MTMREFQDLPEGPPYFELEGGRLMMMASPTSRHQDVVLELAHFMKSYVRERRGGQVFMEVDVYLPDHDHGYIPDISFVSAGRLNLHHADDQKIHGAPDLVVEVLSGQPERDRVEKFRAYYDNGVAWYWIVDPEGLTIEEYHATPDGYLRSASVMAGEAFKPKLFEGLVINLAQLIQPSAPPASPTPTPAQT
jgi:Uma2 family endonuclease